MLPPPSGWVSGLEPSVIGDFRVVLVCTPENPSRLRKPDVILSLTDGFNEGPARELRKETIEILWTVARRNPCMKYPMNCTAGNIQCNKLPNKGMVLTLKIFFPILLSSIID